MKQHIPICGPPLLKSHSEISERGLVVIDTFRRSTRPEFADVYRREIEELPRFQLALTELLFRELARINVRQKDIPANDDTTRVSKWESASMEPAIYAVRPADAVLHVVRFPGFYRVHPCLRDRRKIVVMYDGGPILQFRKSTACI